MWSPACRPDVIFGGGGESASCGSDPMKPESVMPPPPPPPLPETAASATATAGTWSLCITISISSGLKLGSAITSALWSSTVGI